MDKYKIPEGTLEELDIKKVYPDVNNVRQTLNREKLMGLAISLEDIKYKFGDLFPGGLIQPIAVKKKNGTYQIISGHRRYYASILLHHNTIFAKVYDKLTPEQEKSMQLVENETKVPYKTHHTACNIFEFYKLMFAAETGINYEEIADSPTKGDLEKKISSIMPERNVGTLYPISEFAKKINKSPRVIREAFRYAELDGRLQGQVEKENLSYSAAIQIARIPEKKRQHDVWSRIKDKKLSAKRIRKEIKEELQQRRFELKREEKRHIPIHLRELYGNLNKSIRFLKSFLAIEKIDHSVWKYDYAIKLNGGLIGLFKNSEAKLDKIKSKIKENSGYLDWLEKYGDRKRETLQERLRKVWENISAGVSKRNFELNYIPLNQIIRDPKQPRKSFDNLEELAETFNIVGQIHPIVVRPAKLCSYADEKNKFMIVVGERRWRAAGLDISKLKKLEAMVVEINDAEARVLQYEEDLFDEVLLSERAEALYNLFKSKQKEIGESYSVNRFAREYPHLGVQAVLEALKYHSLDKRLKDLHQAGLLRYSAVNRIGDIEGKEKKFEFALESILLDYSDEDIEEKLKKEDEEKNQLKFISEKEMSDMEIRGRRQMLIQELSNRLHSVCNLVIPPIERKTYSNHTVIRKYYELFKLFRKANELMNSTEKR